MRLINADTVATRIEEMPCYYDECIDTIEAIVEMIKYDIPPVKAIPVEWIKNYYTDITSPYTDTRIQFEEMIRKWEKENENII